MMPEECIRARLIFGSNSWSVEPYCSLQLTVVKKHVELSFGLPVRCKQGSRIQNIFYVTQIKDFRATQVRCLTAATAAVTLSFLFLEMLCYVLGRLHSSCVLCTKIGLHRWELINKTLVNDDFSNFLFIYIKSHKFWKF